MRKIFFAFIAFCLLSSVGYSQCTPDINITDPGIYPDTITNLPPAYANQPYAATLQLKVLTDTNTSQGYATITNIIINSVVGMPSGITYQCYNNNCTFPGGSNRCVQVSGIPTVTGTYPITVNITINAKLFGLIPTTQQATVVGYKIVVNPAHVANFEGTPSTICAGGVVNFADLSNYAATSRSWTFTGGTPATSTDQNPVVTYAAAGTYEVSLTTSSVAGTDSETKTAYITVNALPTGTVKYMSNDSTCAGDTVKLQANSAGAVGYQWYKGVNMINGAVSKKYNALTTGTYKVYVTGANGCGKFLAPKKATIVALPAATITPGGPTTFCAGQSVMLNANTGTGLTYRWKKNANFIANATASAYTANKAGAYRVEVQNGFGCKKLSSPVQVVINCREASSVTIPVTGIQLMPNPANDMVNITFTANNNNVNMILTDITGRVVLNKEIEAAQGQVNQLELPLAEFNSGVYFVTLLDGKNKMTAKLIVTAH